MPTTPANYPNRDSFWFFAAEMDYKELPAPPPPSPEIRAAQVSQPIDESLLLSRSDFIPHTERSYTILEADTTRHIATAHHSTLKNSPLRQVASQVDVDSNGRHSPSNHKRRIGGSLALKSVHNRRATLPSPTGRERSLSIPSSQGVSKSSSRNTSPAFNMSYLRSTIQVIPTTPRASSSSHSRSLFEVSPRPPLRGRQISSPIMTQHPSSPALFSSPRPVTPSSASQSRSQSFSTQSTELSQSDELASYFSSDSEDEDETGKGIKLPSSSKNGSLDKRSGPGKSFRRRLSETFALIKCGKD